MEEELSKIVAPLLLWFQKNKRDLPWRVDKNPYYVWISEIMLQQTKIEAVKKYYARFLKELPTIQSLSKVSEEKLLKLWEGLGYYSRARNLKRAAQIIMQDYQGNMPCTYEQLKELPGIGEYTAGAISSICFNEKTPAIDGNVLRVIARITGSKKNILLPEAKKEVASIIQKIIPTQAGDFNEALMELGELVCIPNAIPSCNKCPLKEFCVAYKQELTMEIPVREKEIKRKRQEKTVFLFITDDNKIAIEKRQETGLLSGMYQFPNIEGHFPEEELLDKIKQWDLAITNMQFIQETKHSFTHIDWLMKVYFVKVTTQNELFLWISPQELSQKYPLPTAFLKVTKPLQDIDTKNKRK